MSELNVVDDIIFGNNHDVKSRYNVVGGVGHMAHIFSKYWPGLRTSSAGLVGKDPEGARAKHILTSYFGNDVDMCLACIGKTSTSTVIEDQYTCSEYTKWGACTNFKGVSTENRYDWVHITYLDALPLLKAKNINDINATIKSASLTRVGQLSIEEKDEILEKIGELDYLFISSDDASSLINKLDDRDSIACDIGDMVKKGVILHEEGMSVFSDGNIDNNITTDVVKTVVGSSFGSRNVLAAAFIRNKLHDMDNLQALADAHAIATDFVENK